MMVNLIRLTGISGVIINFVAIITQNIELILIGQLIASISSFLWCRWMQQRVSIDICLSLMLTFVSAITKNQYALYAAMLVRSVSYQFMFERILKQRTNETSNIH